MITSGQHGHQEYKTENKAMYGYVDPNKALNDMLGAEKSGDDPMKKWLSKLINYCENV